MPCSGSPPGLVPARMDFFFFFFTGMNFSASAASGVARHRGRGRGSAAGAGDAARRGHCGQAQLCGAGREQWECKMLEREGLAGSTTPRRGFPHPARAPVTIVALWGATPSPVPGAAEVWHVPSWGQGDVGDTLSPFCSPAHPQAPPNEVLGPLGAGMCQQQPALEADGSGPCGALPE